MNYIDSLNSLFKTASENPGQEIDSEKAQSLIQKMSQTEKSTGFLEYSPAMADAITGMTEVEAFIYLNEILSRLDAQDGASDDNIAAAQSKEAFGQAMTAIGLGDNPSDIQSNLILASDVFKQDDNPEDALYIQALTNGQDGTPISAGDAKLMSERLLSSGVNDNSALSDDRALSVEGGTPELTDALSSPTQPPEQGTVVTAGNAATPKNSNQVVGVYTTFTDVFSGGKANSEQGADGDDARLNGLGVDIVQEPQGKEGDGGDGNGGDDTPIIEPQEAEGFNF
jgi:hypothetical protein